MKIDIKVQSGVIQPVEVNVRDGIYEVSLHNLDTRTAAQNRSIHLWCAMVATELNRRNLSVTAVLKPDITWNTLTVKEQLFKPVLSALKGKASTTRMDRAEPGEVVEVLNKAMGERFGFTVPFPSYKTKEK